MKKGRRRKKKKEENNYTENIALQLCRYKKCRTNEMQRERH